MKTILLNYYDDRRREVFELSYPNLKQFAAENDYQHVIEYAPIYDRPFIQKQVFLRQYLEQCDRLLYCDVDVMFRAGAKGDGLFVSPVNAASDYGGLCAGFLALQSTDPVKKFIRLWDELGLMRYRRMNDQDTFQMLVHNFNWINSLTRGIPQTEVSNLASGVRGSIAHHFWCQNNFADCPVRMKEFIP